MPVEVLNSLPQSVTEFRNRVFEGASVGWGLNSKWLCMLMREASEGKNPGYTLISNTKHPGRWENTFVLFSHRVLWGLLWQLWQKYITSYQRIYVYMLVYMCILGCAYVYKLIKKPMDDHYPHLQKLHSCLLTIIFFLWNIQEEIKGIKLKIKILYPEDTNILKSCILKCCNLFIWRQ